ncbi:glycoside hydrolase family 3 protein [Microbulbifer sp.]|uniref:glycoside hydrolase family 3 protein n=1 Tax=Microbulbifer sp. TaxID=1908541 RepID=UPI003F2DA49E
MTINRLWSACAGLLLAAGLGGCGEKPAEETRLAQEPAPVPWPTIASRATRDEALEQRIETLLARMTAEHKVGQLIQAELKEVTPEDVKNYHLGAILNGGGAFPGNNKYAEVEDWVALADTFYHASMDTGDGGLPIPVIWGTDAVHGHNNVVGATLFPHNIGLGATRNPELVRDITRATAREVAATGIDWTFSPTLAVARDIRWGRSYEAYSEDPQLVARFGAAAVEGLQGAAESEDFLRAGHIIATAKHFIADGGTLDGVDRGDAAISEQELLEIHAPGYFAAIEAGVQTVMASFSSWQGEKLHGHRYLLTEVLKNKMGFDGFVVGDWNGHEFVSGCTRVSCPQSINAGLDMFMAPDASWKQLYANTLAQVKSGEIPRARLDDAVRRILRVKLRAGLFEAGPPSARPQAGDRSVVGAQEHRAIARQAVRESLVLLKNNGELLPLARNSRVLVAGDGAHNIGKQSGGWSISWQGTGNSNSDFPGATSIYQGIAAAVQSAGGHAVLSEDGSFEDDPDTAPDVAIVVFGEDPYAEMQGDIPNLAYDSEADLQLLRQLKAQGIPVVSLFISGRPLWVNREINASDAFVAIWQPGTEGGGVADVLFRDLEGGIQYDFVGRLPFTWPKDAQPLAAGGEPLFALGHGLGYADEGALAQLPEESGLTPRDTAQQLDIFDGRPQDPWSLEIADAQNNRLAVTSSVAKLNGISVRAVDRDMQEDSRRLQWRTAGSAGFYANRRTDLSGYLQNRGALVFDIKVDRPPTGRVQLGINCGTDCGATQPISELLKSAEPGQWRTVSVALQCLAAEGAQLDMVLSPFYLSSDGELDISLHHIRVVENIDADISCG